MEDQGIHFEGEIHGRPIVIGDILELDEKVRKAYAFLRKCDDEVKSFLEPVIATACDTVCNTCHELGFETAEEVVCNPYYCFILDNRKKS